MSLADDAASPAMKRANDEITGNIDLITTRRIRGWAAPINDVDDALHISVIVDGTVVDSQVANLPRLDLVSRFGSGNQHGYDFTIAQGVIRSSSSVVVRAQSLNNVAHDFHASLPDLTISIDHRDNHTVNGWAWNPASPESHVRLRFVYGRDELGFAVANISRADLAEAGIGNGDHGFAFLLPQDMVLDPEQLTIEPAPFDPTITASLVQAISNSEIPSVVGAAIGTSPVLSSSKAPAGQIDWMSLAKTFFDSSWYISQVPELQDADDSRAFAHWWERGRHKNLNPHPLFDGEFYQSQLQDRDIRPADLFLSFLHRGHLNDANPHPCFSMRWYKIRYDLDVTIHPWIDYIENGQLTGREPNWLFSHHWTRALLPEGYELPRLGSWLAAYLQVLGGTTNSPHALLDLPFVLRHNQDVDTTNPYLNFWVVYHKRDIRTHIYFDHKYYVSQINSRVPIIRSLADYIVQGERDNIRPIPYFVPSWHKTYYPTDSRFNSSLEEFAAQGERLYRHPCPGFDPRYYLECNPDVAKAGAPPLRHFMSSGQKERRRCHRRFDLTWYSQRLTEEHRFNALEYWLETGSYVGDLFHPALARLDESIVSRDDLLRVLSPRPSRGDFVPSLATPLRPIVSVGEDRCPSVAGQGWLLDQFVRTSLAFPVPKARALKLDEPISRQLDRFDQQAGIRHLLHLRESLAKSDGLPLVSVIIPTRNRSSVLARALNSVLAQTNANIDVIIVDDGSTDGTYNLIHGYYNDARIRYIAIPASGVSAARNAGLDAARGEYIAYLDSDNYWEPVHLEAVVLSLLASGNVAGYSVLRAFNETGQVKFRGDIYVDEALRRENYIDMNVYVHHRAIRDAGVRFDETLRRCVDWDFILRACNLGPPLFVPVVGCNYVDENGSLERITTDELSGDFYRICQRGIRLEPHITGTAPNESVDVSIILPVSNDHWPDVRSLLWKFVHFVSASDSVELIIVGNGLNDAATAYLASLSSMTVRVRVIHLWRTFHLFPAYNLASTVACGGRLLLWRADVDFLGDDLLSFVDGASAKADAAFFPLVIDDNGLVASDLAVVDCSFNVISPILTGSSASDVQADGLHVFPVSSPLLIGKKQFDLSGGIAPSYALHLGLAELCLRLQLSGEMPIELSSTYRFRSKGLLNANKEGREYLKEFDSLRATYLRDKRLGELYPRTRQLRTPQMAKPINRNWTLFANDKVGQIASPFAITRPLRIVIRCPSPKTEERFHWGDFHYARAMAKCFTQFGHAASIQFRDEWNEPVVADVVVHIRGIVDVIPVPNALNVMWVISHPDRVSIVEYQSADVVFAAGPALARDLRRRLGIDARVLLQAADISGAADASVPTYVADRALFVGNSRMQARTIVLDAIEAEVPLAVYGADWESLIPSSYVAGRYIDNGSLRSWYGGAGVVLNDHWPSMKQFGIISNRIFDVASVGTAVITDYVEGLDEIFGESVRTYSDIDDLARLFSELGGRRFPDVAAYVSRNHSIINRVFTICETLGIKAR